MISEGSCDTDWRNDAENSAAHHRNKSHIKIENRYFKLQYFTKPQTFTVFFDQINTSLMRIENIFSKTLLTLNFFTETKLW